MCVCELGVFVCKFVKLTSCMFINLSEHAQEGIVIIFVVLLFSMGFERPIFSPIKGYCLEVNQK